MYLTGESTSIFTSDFLYIKIQKCFEVYSIFVLSQGLIFFSLGWCGTHYRDSPVSAS